jgi:DNA-binding winged helix-turn-helix (wHTH) protein
MKEFPPFWLDTVTQCLWRRTDSGEDKRLLLRPKPFAILRYLVEHAGRLVPHPRSGSTLVDDSRNPVFLETLPRHEYRFVARIHEDGSPEADVATKPGRGPVVGRDRALGELQEYLGSAMTGQREIVFIAGEPGIGKNDLGR